MLCEFNIPSIGPRIELLNRLMWLHKRSQGEKVYLAWVWFLVPDNCTSLRGHCDCKFQMQLEARSHCCVSHKKNHMEQAEVRCSHFVFPSECIHTRLICLGERLWSSNRWRLGGNSCLTTEKRIYPPTNITDGKKWGLPYTQRSNYTGNIIWCRGTACSDALINNRYCNTIFLYRNNKADKWLHPFNVSYLFKSILLG